MSTQTNQDAPETNDHLENQETKSPAFRPTKIQQGIPKIGQSSTPQEIYFPNKNKATILVPPPDTDAAQIQSALALEDPNAILLVIGALPKVTDTVNSRLTQLLSRGVAKTAAKLEALIIDNGQDKGITAMIGQGVADRGYHSNLVGVAPVKKVTFPEGVAGEGLSGDIPLDHNHSHFVLTDGDQWAEATHTMYQMAARLGREKPVITILIGGDDLTKTQVLQSVRNDWPIIVIKGTGHLADEIADLWQTRPTFIPDAALAEIIVDGNLYFTPLDGPISSIERLIDQLSYQDEDTDTTLELAWRTFTEYDINASRQQKTFLGLQKWVLVLGVVGTLLALTQTQLEIIRFPFGPELVLFGNELGPIGYNILYIIILIIPITLTFLANISNRQNAGTKWILSRASAESVKKEIYRYRARAEIYGDQQTKTLSRDIKLTRKLDAISSRLMQTEVNTSAIPAYDGPIPPQYGAADGDDGLTFLTPERYLKYRLKDQLAYYRGKTVQLERQLKRLQWLIYASGAVGTFVAAIGLELWIALTTAFVTAFTTYLEYQRVEERLMRYNQTATDLDNIERWWVALSAEEQAYPESLDLLVGQTETSIHSEHAAWVQDMQDAMAELRAEQTSEETQKSQTSDEASEQNPTKKILATNR